MKDYLEVAGVKLHPTSPAVPQGISIGGVKCFAYLRVSSVGQVDGDGDILGLSGLRIPARPNRYWR